MQDVILKIKERFNFIEQQLQDPAVISDTQKLKEFSSEHADLQEKMGVIQQIDDIQQGIEEAQANLEDADFGEMAQEELEKLTPKLEELYSQLQLLLLPKDTNDSKDIIVEIRAGAGGDESALFAGDLFRMYGRFAENMGWKTEIINMNKMELGGYKEITFNIKGKNVYKNLKFESGVHRVQRVPATEKSGRVHTSTATVAVLPEAEDVDIEINPKDLRIDTFRASGAGGQHVNKTDSAIRITHIPTGTVASCQSERSQQQNKDRAMIILRSRLLAEQERQKQEERESERRAQVGSGDRSEKIRTYNYPQDRITDHRIPQSWKNMQIILDGALDPIITALQDELNRKLLEQNT